MWKIVVLASTQAWILGSLKKMEPSVSVLICARNVEKYIGNCLRSILDQSFKDFEIVIIDDQSTDKTRNMIEKFDDKRIRYFRNEKWLGISKSRNRSLEYAGGWCLFFTDGDCTVARNWIEEGLRFLRDSNCIGVEGRIYYVSEDYEPTFSDHIVQNRHGGHFMTGNIAYKKKAVEDVGGFDERLDYLEDRDIALRIMKQGKIRFNREMIVYHPQVILKPRRFVESAARIRNRVLLFKKYGELEFLLWRILFPVSLVKILFPPLVFSSLLLKRFRNSDDFRLLPFAYIHAICQRLQLWKECARQRVFLL